MEGRRVDRKRPRRGETTYAEVCQRDDDSEDATSIREDTVFEKAKNRKQFTVNEEGPDRHRTVMLMNSRAKKGGVVKETK